MADFGTALSGLVNGFVGGMDVGNRWKDRKREIHQQELQNQYAASEEKRREENQRIAMERAADENRARDLQNQWDQQKWGDNQDNRAVGAAAADATRAGMERPAPLGAFPGAKPIDTPQARNANAGPQVQADAPQQPQTADAGQPDPGAIPSMPSLAPKPGDTPEVTQAAPGAAMPTYDSPVQVGAGDQSQSQSSSSSTGSTGEDAPPDPVRVLNSPDRSGPRFAPVDPAAPMPRSKPSQPAAPQRSSAPQAQPNVAPKRAQTDYERAQAAAHQASQNPAKRYEQPIPNTPANAFEGVTPDQAVTTGPDRSRATFAGMDPRAAQKTLEQPAQRPAQRPSIADAVHQRATSPQMPVPGGSPNVTPSGQPVTRPQPAAPAPQQSAAPQKPAAPKPQPAQGDGGGLIPATDPNHQWGQVGGMGSDIGQIAAHMRDNARDFSGGVVRGTEQLVNTVPDMVNSVINNPIRGIDRYVTGKDHVGRMQRVDLNGDGSRESYPGQAVKAVDFHNDTADMPELQAQKAKSDQAAAHAEPQVNATGKPTAQQAGMAPKDNPSTVAAITPADAYAKALPTQAARETQAAGETATNALGNNDPGFNAAASALPTRDLGVALNVPLSAGKASTISNKWKASFAENGVPMIVDTMMRQGNFDDARKFTEWAKAEKTQAGMNKFFLAVTYANAGQTDQAVNAVMDAYNTAGYFDDGYTVDKKRSKLMRDPNGNVNGVDMVLFNKQTGQYERSQRSLGNFLRDGIMMLSPEQAYAATADAEAAQRKQIADMAAKNAETQRDILKKRDEQYTQASIDRAQKAEDARTGMITDTPDQVRQLAQSIYKQNVDLNGTPKITMQQAVEEAQRAFTGQGGQQPGQMPILRRPQ
ncbi:hypothetical protein BMI86_10325 [Thioclava sp. DLFJ5-1]|uniref:hypothetical protein n=1 Tax=Thioclava sp. DLFJ5-1 TaxID=1915314 RepID=UPI00099667D2|nr:hypothetical protein [Thioclava sp. DLFJ5-1]OOY20892.1 hypothetical protein BMI86_10325 [Thioclava sp. DLFJ5-1]